MNSGKAMHVFASQLRFEDLPPAVVDRLALSYMDAMGVAAVASTTAMSKKARQVAPLLFGPGEGFQSRALIDGTPLSPAGAAMAGAFTIDAVDAHDGTTPCQGHAGSAVWPALLALADSKPDGMSGADFLTHAAVAYEVSYRAGLAQHASCADYHTSGAWTAVGVAAACARMLDCDEQQIRHAAGIGEYHGPRSQMMRCIDHPTNLRDGVGWGAPSGVTAAFLAQAGFTGAPALTCEDAPAFWQDLGIGWRITDHTHDKAYPCCRWAHPAIDGVKHLMKVHKLKHSDIAEIEIHTFHKATRLAGHAPETSDEFAYAIAFPVAVMAVRGQIGVAELAEGTLADTEILDLSHRIRLIDDAEITALSTQRRYARVCIVTMDGKRLDDQVRAPRGDVEDPLSLAEMIAKYHAFADPVVGTARATEMRDLALGLANLNEVDFKRLLDLCLSS